jgi:hypothetical protein
MLESDMRGDSKGKVPTNLLEAGKRENNQVDQQINADMR